MLHVSKQSKVILTQTIYHMLYRQFTVLLDYSIHLHLPKQPVVIYSFLSTDDSLDRQSSSETKRRIFPSTDKASQQMEGTTVDPEGIPDDLIIICCWSKVLDLFIKIVNIIWICRFSEVLGLCKCGWTIATIRDKSSWHTCLKWVLLSTISFNYFYFRSYVHYTKRGHFWEVSQHFCSSL